MTITLALSAFTGAAVLGTISLALVQAEQHDPDADPFKRLNLMLAQVVGGIALVVTALCTSFFYGLLRPGLVALVLYAGYRFALRQDLSTFYPFNYAFAILAVIFAVIAMLNITSTHMVVQQ